MQMQESVLIGRLEAVVCTGIAHSAVPLRVLVYVGGCLYGHPVLHIQNMEVLLSGLYHHIAVRGYKYSKVLASQNISYEVLSRYLS